MEAETPGSLPGYANPAKLTVASGATMAVSTIGWLSTDIDSLIHNSAFTTGNLGIDVPWGSFTYGTAITHTIGFVKLGDATLVLTGANSYNGPTNITAGTLQIGNGGTVGTLGSGDVINDGPWCSTTAAAAR